MPRREAEDNRVHVRAMLSPLVNLAPTIEVQEVRGAAERETAPQQAIMLVEAPMAAGPETVPRLATVRAAGTEADRRPLRTTRAVRSAAVRVAGVAARRKPAVREEVQAWGVAVAEGPVLVVGGGKSHERANAYELRET